MYFDWRLLRETRGSRGLIVLAVILGLLALAAGIARFAVLGWLVAHLFVSGSVPAFEYVVAGIVALIVARAALDHARAMIAFRVAARMQESLRRKLYDRIVSLGPAWFTGERTGGVMLSVIDGVEQLQPFFGQYIPQVCIGIAAPVVIFAFMAFWDVPVAAVLMVGALLALALPAATQHAGSVAAMARLKSFKAFGADLLDAIQGLPTLKGFGQGKAFGAKLARRARELTESTMFVVRASTATRGVTDLAIAGGAVGAMVLGAWRVGHGQMSLEALLIVLMAGTEIFRPLRDLRAVLHQGMVGQSAAIGIKRLLEAVPASPPSTGRLAPALDSSVVFNDVRFTYPGVSEETHRGLSFAARPGERIGIVGASGSGKSTIVKLLLGFNHATGGTIAIGGHDVATLDPAHVRRQIAVVQQDTYLFYGTVADNIRLGRPDATREQVEAAARAANAHDFITALPEGYETILGERATRLSGGQRQRVAIARALLRDSPILILDEALSSVDAENEAVIQAALERLMQGRTTLILAHRLSSVIGADRILVLDKGQVAQSGRHAELITREGPYRSLMAEQAEAGDVRADDLLEAPRDVAGPADAPRAAPGSGDVAGVAELGRMATLASMTRLIWPWRGQLALTVFSGIGRIYGLLAVSVLSALVVAAVRDGSATTWLLVALVVTAPLAAFLQWIESWQSHDMAYRLLAEMRITLFAKLEQLAPGYLLRRRSGDLVALSTQDVETVEYFFAHTVAPAVIALLLPASVVIALALIAWPTALAIAPFLIAAGLAPVLGNRRMDRHAGRARAGLGGLNAFVTDTIQGLSELTAFDALARREAEFVRLLRDYRVLRLRLLDDLSAQGAVQEMLAALGALAVIVVAAMMAQAGALQPYLVALLGLLAGAAFLPISELAQAARLLADTIASVRRLHQVHGEPVAITDGPRDLPARRGGPSITFENVAFRYRPGLPPALADVSFTVPRGARVALVGPSGAGKTTIANLLLRFWDPASGAIRFDGIDLREMPVDAARAQIALVAQDTYLFNDTLAENIRLARPDADDAAVMRAVERAALGGFVAGLPQGLETRVGERGLRLSGGQRQRVAIARAFLKDAPILVLDEATSHLDAVSELHVRAALAELSADRTTIAIAHRLSTIRSADLILVVAQGRIREAGTHGELLARGGLYAALVRTQTAGAQGPRVAE